MGPSPVWTRDKHLLDLTLYRVVMGDPEVQAAARVHLSTCARCRSRLDQQHLLIARVIPQGLELLASLTLSAAPDPEDNRD